MRHGKIETPNNTYGSYKGPLRSSPNKRSVRKGITHQASPKNQFSVTYGGNQGFHPFRMACSPLLSNEELTPAHMKSTFHQHPGVRMSPSGVHILQASFNN